MDVFQAVLTAKHDEGLAAIRDFIVRSGDDEMCKYACNLIIDFDESKDDDAEHIRNAFAFLGLCHAWLTVMNEPKT